MENPKAGDIVLIPRIGIQLIYFDHESDCLRALWLADRCEAGREDLGATSAATESWENAHFLGNVSSIFKKFESEKGVLP